MKILVISDIHGDIDALNKVLTKEEYNKVFFLGDAIDYYGNDYGVSERLDSINEILTRVKGNCDNGNIPKVLTVTYKSKSITLTHGDLFNQYNYNCKDLLLVGHTHKGKIERFGDLIVANPGSIRKGRDNYPASYIVIDGNYIILKNMDNNIIKKQLF